jgi:hypothetical protein
MSDAKSLPELELNTARAREALTDAVATIKQKSNVPERWRLFVARSRQQMHRDPTPLVAMIVIAAAGVASIVVGTRIGNTRAGHLDAAATPALLPQYKPAKTGKDGRYKGPGKLKRKPDKQNPREQDKKEWAALQKKLRKQQKRAAR